MDQTDLEPGEVRDPMPHSQLDGPAAITVVTAGGRSLNDDGPGSTTTGGTVVTSRVINKRS